MFLLIICLTKKTLKETKKFIANLNSVYNSLVYPVSSLVDNLFLFDHVNEKNCWHLVFD